MTLLTLEDVTLGYEGHAVTEHISFSLTEGDYLFIVGENGAGKSTLLKAVLRLVPPLSGHVRLEGGLSRDEIGYLPQRAQVEQDFPASVREVVMSGFLNRCGLRPFYSKKERAEGEEIMKKMGVWALRRLCYRELSGGQQQRTLLARALAAARRLLLLDEPAAGLDPGAAKDLYTLVERLNKEEGMTVMMVSHDIPAALTYASDILHIGAAPLYFGNKEGYLKSGLAAGMFHERGAGV